MSSIGTMTAPRPPRLTLKHVAAARLISRKLGRAIREERVRQHQTQLAISLALGVSLPTYRGLEAGKPTVSSGLVISALVLLGIEGSLKHLVADQPAAPKK